MLKDWITRDNEFDARVGILQMEKALELSVGDRLLEIGCGEGRYTQMFFEKFDLVVGLDLDKKNVEKAREQLGEGVYVTADAQDFDLGEKFDTILVANILEHVDRPIDVLKCAKKHLTDKGRIIIIVPNAWSFNRQIGKEMGLIKELNKVPEEQVKRFGHKRVYDPFTLSADIGEAGLEIIESGGIVFKPFANKLRI